MAIQGVEPLNPALVKSYAHDLFTLLTETDIVKSKVFLRSFIDRIVIEGTMGTIHYKLPVPYKWKEQDEFSVLPIEPPKWSRGDSNPLPPACKALLIKGGGRLPPF